MTFRTPQQRLPAKPSAKGPNKVSQQTLPTERPSKAVQQSLTTKFPNKIFQQGRPAKQREPHVPALVVVERWIARLWQPVCQSRSVTYLVSRSPVTRTFNTEPK